VALHLDEVALLQLRLQGLLVSRSWEPQARELEKKETLSQTIHLPSA
jgi:hypothetical protein